MNAALHAIRTATALRSAQCAYDSLGEPPPAEAGCINEQIRLAEEALVKAWRTLNNDDDVGASRALIRDAIAELELALEDE